MSTILHRFPTQSKPPAKNTTKVCKTCPENGPQPLENFNKHISMGDGRYNDCRICQKAKKKESDRKRKEGLINPILG